jgi:hypothetical protein
VERAEIGVDVVDIDAFVALERVDYSLREPSRLAGSRGRRF